MSHVEARRLSSLSIAGLSRPSADARCPDQCLWWFWFSHVRPDPADLDQTTAPASDAFVWNVVSRIKGTVPLTGITSGTASFNSQGSGATFSYTASGGAITSIGTVFNGGSGYKVGDIITPTKGNSDAYLVVSTVSGTAVTGLAVSYGGSGYTTGTATSISAALDTNNIYVLTGTLTGNVTFLVKPGTYGSNSNSWIIVNNTTGAYTVSGFLSNGTNSGSIGSGVVIPQGTNSNHPVQIFTDGVNDIWLTLPVYATTTTASALVQSNSSGAIDPSFIKQVAFSANKAGVATDRHSLGHLYKDHFWHSAGELIIGLQYQH